MIAADGGAIGQLVNGVLVPGLAGSTVPDWLGSEIDRGVRAVCWFEGDALGDVRQRFADVLVLADEEGGNVTRLEAATGSSFPGNAALGVLDDIDATERVASAIGAMARRAGIDVVLAPVVDVNSEPTNPVIGVRSFGDRPDLVARHGAAFVRGVQSRGVAACAKHFPGHGATRTDSHFGLPVVDADLGTFMSRDVAPFAAAIQAGVRCVLTAHVVVPAVDDKPATMSAAWLGLLRDRLGFDGVVISDALDMHGISRRVGRGAGAVEALRSGVDLVCIGNPRYPERYEGAAVLDQIRVEIVGAVRDGKLPVARLEEAARRVAELADWSTAARRSRAAGPDVGHEGVAAIGREVAGRAVRAIGAVRLDSAPHVIVERRTNVAAGGRGSPIVAALVRRASATTYVEVRDVSELAALREANAEQRLVLVTDGLAGDSVVRAVREARQNAIVVYTGPVAGRCPIDAPALMALGNGAANAAAVADLLIGPS